jgi:hypothetical protein
MLGQHPKDEKLDRLESIDVAYQSVLNHDPSQSTSRTSPIRTHHYGNSLDAVDG